MKRRQKRTLLIIAGAVALVALTAGATTYVTGNMPELGLEQKAETSKPVISTNTVQTSTRVQSPAPLPPACDDNNVVGKVLGGAVGGIAGSQIGKGNGKTAATIGGTVGGTLLGEKYIPTDNVTCR